MKIGDRVFVGGTTGKYGYVTGVITSSHGPREFMVQLGNTGFGHSGPFSDVRPAP